ncbi:hypothetical protein KBB76_01855 [Candidatus Saccharibacteria bacterium]|nr:hypothetical protein [Candidatus Saccharibacteria bacterium]HOR23648.1 hypothetical protein [Candidatus Saccharibacteria bacterium]HPW48046.1 hypothetical protein [Candidatus Saccharibacteria bacterium]
MNKKTKIEIIVFTAVALLAFDLALIFTGTRGQTINAFWAMAMGFLTAFYGVLALITAKYWSWLHSKIGQAVFFIGAGNFIWGAGQLVWAYYFYRYPNQEYQPQRILDVLFFSAVPLWFYGVLKLTKASGAKYGLKKLKGKLLVLFLVVFMGALSYYLLVFLAREGSAYFNQPLWEQFFDLGYSVGDAIIFTVALAIFGLSWRLLGGRFKAPVIVMLAGFGVMYVADVLFSYLGGKELYYNGDISDMLYLAAVVIISAGACLLDPTKLKPIYAPGPAPEEAKLLNDEQTSADRGNVAVGSRAESNSEATSNEADSQSIENNNLSQEE